MAKSVFIAAIIVLFLAGCKSTQKPPAGVEPSPAETALPISVTETAASAETLVATKPAPASPVKLPLTSPAFAAGASIPVKYTCKGEDISPELEWGEPPAGTQSFALILDDPDAPVGAWVHWVVYYIPAEVRSLEQGVANGKRFDDVALLFGKNSWGRTAYGGPCPPSGTHRYFFKLYALDTVPVFPENADKKAVEAAMDGHVLGYGELMGTFSK